MAKKSTSQNQLELIDFVYILFTYILFEILYFIFIFLINIVIPIELVEQIEYTLPAVANNIFFIALYFMWLIKKLPYFGPIIVFSFYHFSSLPITFVSLSVGLFLGFLADLLARSSAYKSVYKNCLAFLFVILGYQLGTFIAVNYFLDTSMQLFLIQMSSRNYIYINQYLGLSGLQYIATIMLMSFFIYSFAYLLILGIKSIKTALAFRYKALLKRRLKNG